LTTDNFGLIERFKGFIDYENLITIEMEISVTIIIAELYFILKASGFLFVNLLSFWGLLKFFISLIFIVIIAEILSRKIQAYLISQGSALRTKNK
jgi:hypothetical protein